MKERESGIKPIGKLGSFTVIEDTPEIQEEVRKGEEAAKEYIREQEKLEKQK